MRNRRQQRSRPRRPAGFRLDLIRLAFEFCRKAAEIKGVERIGMIGSITTTEQNPKDIDLVVTIGTNADMGILAKVGRQLQGRAQGLSSGADIFLVNDKQEYLGRVCHYSDCRPWIRASCQALNCGRNQYICDDLDSIRLDSDVVAHPPVVLYPQIIIQTQLPEDLSDALAHAKLHI